MRQVSSIEQIQPSKDKSPRVGFNTTNLSQNPSMKELKAFNARASSLPKISSKVKLTQF